MFAALNLFFFFLKIAKSRKLGARENKGEYSAIKKTLIFCSPVKFQIWKNREIKRPRTFMATNIFQSATACSMHSVYCISYTKCCDVSNYYLQPQTLRIRAIRSTLLDRKLNNLSHHEIFCNGHLIFAKFKAREIHFFHEFAKYFGREIKGSTGNSLSHWLSSSVSKQITGTLFKPCIHDKTYQYMRKINVSS